MKGNDMNYVIELLTQKAKDEEHHRESAKLVLKSSTFPRTVEAAKESIKLASERIPQLYKAIKILENK